MSFKLSPAPPMPMEPGDPLELNEANRLALSSMEALETPLKVFQEQAFPWMQATALLTLLILLPSFIRWLKRYQKRSSPNHVSKEEAALLLKNAGEAEGENALDLYYSLLYRLPKSKQGASKHDAHLILLLQKERYRGGPPDAGTILALKNAFEKLVQDRYTT